jgi:hypothetical protein
MKTKTLVYLGIVLALIVGVVLLSEKLSGGKTAESSKKFFPDFSTGKCSAFRISDAKESVKIVKKGQSWFVVLPGSQNAGKTPALGQDPGALNQAIESDYPADSASVVSVIEKLGFMSMDDKISQNPEKQKLFEVDSAQGTLVEVWDNSTMPIGTFYIGKNGPSWENHYVRIKGTNDVYSVSGSIKYAFFSDLKRWKDKTAMRFDKSQVKKITVAQKDSATIMVEKSVDSLKNPLWNIAAPEKRKGKAQAETVNKVLDALSNLVTADWEENPAIADTATGLTKPSLAITVDLENGDKKFITVGKEKGTTSQVYVRTSYKNDLFLIYKSLFTDMEKGIGEYLETKDAVAPVAKPAATKKVKEKKKK